MVIGAAMVTNVRGIQQCLSIKKKQENEQSRALKGQNCLEEQSF